MLPGEETDLIQLLFPFEFDRTGIIPLINFEYGVDILAQVSLTRTGSKYFTRSRAEVEIRSGIAAKENERVEDHKFKFHCNFIHLS